MRGKKKYSDEFKLQIVFEYLDGHSGGYRCLEDKYGIGYAIIRHWVALYKAGGVEQLTNVTRTFSGDFKVHVVEYMHQNALSVRKTAAYFGIQSIATVSKWERIYYEEGKEALYIERRGRKMSKESSMPKKDLNKDEDLLAEVQRLRMENEYLKKLIALTQEREQEEQKTK